MLLCLPCDTGKYDCSKSAFICLIVVFGCASVYMVSKLLNEVLIQDFADGLCMIQILLTVAIFAISGTIFFIHQNYNLYRKIESYQKLAQELCYQRDFDMLSGLKNRNAFIRFAQQVEKRKDNISVIVCDIDGLKIINDTLGHMAGDKIIRKSAEILIKACPSNAKIFRTGGDEYVVIIQELFEEQKLMELRQSIKVMIASYNTTHPSIPLSISIGFASTATNRSEFWEVYKEADYNMYHEKRICQEKVYSYLRTAFIDDNVTLQNLTKKEGLSLTNVEK